MGKLGAFAAVLFVLLALLFGPVLVSPHAITGNYGDVYLHYYPMKALVNEHLQTGALPLWNPYIFAGEPLQANPQSAVFYPLSFLFSILPLPSAFSCFFLLHLFLAGLFMYLLLASYRFAPTAAAMGSLAYALSSFLIYKVPAGHPVALSGYVWLPLAILALDNLDRKRSPAAVVFLAAVFSFQFLSGHTFPVYITAVFTLLHFASRRFRYWPHLLAAIVLTVIFSALQLLPTAQLARLTEKANWPELVRSYSMPFRNLVNIVLPNFFGNIRDANFIFPDNPSFFFERHGLYFGLIPALLAAAGIVLLARARRFFYPAVLAAGLLLALGFYTPLYRVLYRALPGMDLLRVPARFYFLCLVSLIVAAAFAWNAYLSPRSRGLKIVLLAFIAFDLLWWGNKFIYPETIDAYRRPSEVSQYVDPRFRLVTDAGMPSNKSMMYHQYNLNGYEAILLEDFTRYIGLQERQVLSTTGLARTDLSSPLAKGFSAAYDVTPADRTDEPRIASLPNGLGIYAFPDPLPRVFFPERITVIPDAEVYEQVDHLQKSAYSPDKELLLGHLPPPFKDVSRGGTLLSFTPKAASVEAEVRLTSPGPVTFSEIAYPGWRAIAGGKETRIFRGNKVFRTLLLPEGDYTGKNRIILFFDPVPLRGGLYATLLALALAFAYFIVPRFKALTDRAAAGRLRFDKQLIS